MSNFKTQQKPIRLIWKNKSQSKRKTPFRVSFLWFGGAEGNLRSLSRLAAALRSAHAFSLTPLWRKNVSPTRFFSPFDSLQNKQKNHPNGWFLCLDNNPNYDTNFFTMVTLPESSFSKWASKQNLLFHARTLNV